MLKHGSLFSGIGGFDLAAQWAGWENIFHCEINPFGQKVLSYYWPNSIQYHDITKTDFTIHRGNIDILTGGFPCQPYSAAGKRLGKEDERHLWPEMLRAIREISPRWVVGENVLGITNWSGGLVFEEVQADLEAEGYEVQAYVLPACGVNAPHKRDRVWFIAYSGGDGYKLWRFGKDRQTQGESESIENKRKWIRSNIGRTCEQRNVTDTNSTGLQDRQLDGSALQGITRERINTSDNYSTIEKCFAITSDTNLFGCERGGNSGKLRTEREDRNKRFENLGFISKQNWEVFPSESPVYSGNDGFSVELSGLTFSKHRQESIKALGNAIVPQVVYQIFKSINLFESKITKP